VTEYYYGKLENTDGPETCRYRGYGADADSEHNDYRKWQVLAARLAFVVVFEVRVIMTDINLKLLRKIIMCMSDKRTILKISVVIFHLQ